MLRSCAALVLLTAIASRGFAEEPSVRKAAADVLARHGSSLAAVKLTILHRTLVDKKPVREMEHTVEAAGFAIRADGVVAVAASALDYFPSLPAAAPIEIEELTAEFQTKGIRIRYGNGREVDAKLLGRDADRDLAFFKPAEKAGEPNFIPLDSPAGSPRIADPAILLYPLTNQLRHRPAVAIRGIAALVEASGKLPVLDTSEHRHLGSPVFDTQGRFLGIATTVRPPQKPHEYLGNFENASPDIVIRSASVIAASLQKLEVPPSK